MAVGKYKELLKFTGFQPFLYTQFLGAFNDNLFKMVISLFAVNIGFLSNHESSYLSLVGAVFILPFLLFSGFAGYLSDRFNKRTVFIITKSTEVIASSIGCWALLSGRMEWMLSGLFLMALHSTFFSPAKYGILPEMLPPGDLSRANGLLEMSTFLAIILGTSMGGVLFAFLKNQPGRIGSILVAIALTGTLISFGTGRVPSPISQPLFHWNPWKETIWGTHRLYQQAPLGMAVICISFFWFFGALLQMNILLFGKEILGLSDLQIGLLGGFLALGIGVGSVLAGYLSGNKIELGLVPLGLLGLAIFSLLLSLSGGSYLQFSVILAMLGCSGGVFIVPLNAFLQQQSDPGEKGRILATNNFFNMAGVLLASGVLWIFRDILKVPPDRILLIFGILLIGSAYFLLTRFPYFFTRFLLWIFARLFYSIDLTGDEQLSGKAPVILISPELTPLNHLLISASIQNPIRSKTSRPLSASPSLKRLYELANPVPSGMLPPWWIHELNQGHIICLDPEDQELIHTLKKEIPCFIIPVIVIPSKKKLKLFSPIKIIFEKPLLD